MESRQFLCFPLQLWTMIVAWLQIIFNAKLLLASTLIVAYSLSTIYHDRQAALEHAHQIGDKFTETEMLANDMTINTEVSIFMAIMIVVMFRFFLGINMGIYLLRGVKQQDGQKLKCWMVYKGILITLTTIGSVVLIYEVIVNDLWWLSPIIAIPVFLELIFLCLVNEHREELEIHQKIGLFTCRSEVIGYFPYNNLVCDDQKVLV